MKKATLILLICLCAILPSCTFKNIKTSSSAISQPLNIRLYDDVIPRSYDLTLLADPGNENFLGQVAIDLELGRDRTDILINSQDITVSSLKIYQGTEVADGHLVKVDEDGLAKINFNRVLKAGKYRLEIRYEGHYQKDLLGLYRVKEGTEHYLFTQFEPLSARKMLPCFDEPRFKTPFRLKVVTAKENHVIANAPLERTLGEGDLKTHEFALTKPIPTYLLALAIGPFDIVSGPDLPANSYRKEVLPFRGIATKGKGENLALALRETPKILAKLEDYFQSAYPFQKLDIIAVPDFGAGAMENPGAVTFREWFLLMPEKSVSIEQKRDFYVVMAHELGHMWFGNLVTMPWWDDLWLNEAFATWLSYKVTGDLKPEYKTDVRILQRSHNAMAQDSLSSARKIREPILSNHDIHNAFDGITYSKGGAVLSMLENYLGPQKFREAVIYHLQSFAHKNATSNDFLASLAKYSDQSLSTSANTFLNQRGVPNIDISYECKPNGFTVFARQERYVPIGAKISKDHSWSVPMCLSYEAQGRLVTRCMMLDEREKALELVGEKCPVFIAPNAKGQGYYRFTLSPANWQNLLNAPVDLLTEGERVAIADSLIASLYAGKLGFDFVARNLARMIDGRSALISQYFIDFLDETHNFWLTESNIPKLNSFAEDVFFPLYGNLRNKKILSVEEQILKRDITKFLAQTVKHKLVKKELAFLGESYLEQTFKQSAPSTKVDENFIDDAVAEVLQQQDDAYLSKVMSKLKDEKDTLIRKHLIFGLSQSRTGEKAENIRRLVFDESLRGNEQLWLFYQHLDNPKNQPPTWAFLKNNLASFGKIFTKSKMGNLPYLAQGLCSEDHAREVATFFAPVIDDYEGGPRNLKEVIEGIEICAARKAHTEIFANEFFAARKNAEVAGAK